MRLTDQLTLRTLLKNLRIPPSWHWPLFLIVCLIVGAVLRLIWGLDIEYKGDENYMFLESQRKGFFEALFHPGMLSGVFVPNPGLSVAVFVALARIFHATTPPDLAQTVQLLNITALGILAWFALTKIEKPLREAWLWGTALVCVNPIAVLLHRKIWAQSVLPFFCMLTILGWHYRTRRWGALLWGFVGALLGQIHLSGFFVALMVFVWTLIKKYPARWGYWLLGSVLGAIPLVSWGLALVNAPKGPPIPSNGWNLNNLIEGFWSLWLTDSLGLGLAYSLHKAEFIEFLKYPYLGAQPLYLVGVAHLLLIGMGLRILYLALQGLWRNRPGRRDLILGSNQNPSLTLEKASFWGYGILLHLTGVRVPRHYLLITFPLEWVWISRLALARPQTKRFLPWIWVLQLFLSSLFLYYIHENYGAPTGDYGYSYRHLLRAKSRFSQ